jgi:hypothetical protein
MTTVTVAGGLLASYFFRNEFKLGFGKGTRKDVSSKDLPTYIGI